MSTELDILTEEGENLTLLNLDLVLSEMNILSACDPRFRVCAECKRIIPPTDLCFCVDCAIEKRRQGEDLGG